MRKRNRELRKRNEHLRKGNGDLRKRNGELKKGNEDMRRRKGNLRSEMEAVERTPSACRVLPLTLRLSSGWQYRVLHFAEPKFRMT